MFKERFSPRSIALVLLFALIASAQQRKINQVENSLLYPVAVDGQDVLLTLADRMKSYNVPGVSVAVVNNGRVEWARGYGVLESGGKDPVDAETLFQAASISKTVSAFGVLVLVRNGVLNLDKDVNTYLESWKLPENEFTKTEKVTLRHLLSHTGGLSRSFVGSYGSDQKPFSLLDALEGKDDSQNPRPVRVRAVPGTEYNYSGGGFSVIQQVITDVMGRPFDDVMRELVLNPIGMRHSRYQMPLQKDLRRNVATGHRRNGDVIPDKGLVLPETAAGGLWTTPTDIALFIIEIQKARAGKSRLLSKKLADEMLSPQKNSGSWGLGFDLKGLGQTPYFQHGGVNIGYESWMAGSFDTGQGVVVMTNTNSGGQRLALEIIRGVARVYGWSFATQIAKNAKALDPKEQAAYIGRYRFNDDIFIVKMENAKLMIQRPNSSFRELFAESKHKFFVRESEVEYVFEMNDRGEVVKLTETFPYTAGQVATKIKE
jgi:CubicO group peptidase (beta-lactamase class C family)